MRNSNRLGCLTGTGILAILITTIVMAGYAYASGGLIFSPGPLSAKSGETLGGVTSHSEIGRDCKACHTAPWESATMADRCAVCHAEIASDMRNVASMHGKMLHDNPNLSCRHCHPDHRGANAQLTVMESGLFPHEAVGYSLKGHQFTATKQTFVCDDCHHGDISTFASDSCQTCHSQMDLAFTQAHLLAFGTDCLACHDGVDRYGDNFNHSRFVFQLTGKHATVICTQCHLDARTIADLQSTPQDCFSCHRADEPHEGRFGSDCAACHSTDGWKPAKFDHDKSNFPLTGRHTGLACEQCHTTSQFAGLSTTCSNCHSDPAFHVGMFGLDCAQCHTTENWFARYNGSHPGIADEGGSGVNHGGGSCRDCHTQTLRAATCTKCHDSNNPDGEGGEGGGGGDN